jgi:Domain of unknown function (DUF3859)
MQSKCGVAIALGFLLCGSLRVAAEGPAGIRVAVDAYGLFRLLPAPATPAPAAPQSGVGALYANRAILVKQTRNIEACVGNSFGYHLTGSGLRPGTDLEFRKVVTHPPMTMADGQVKRGYELPQSTSVLSDGTFGTYQGFSFDEPNELVAGHWTIAFWHAHRKLASEAFTVVPCAAGR